MINVEDVFESQRTALERLSPPIEAVGVGGSFGTGGRDLYSDADFFILYPTEGFFDFLRGFPEQITHPRPVLVMSGPVFVTGFGFEYSYILEGGVAVDYNLNCRETLSLNPMRSNTRVIFDATGFLTEFTAHAAREEARSGNADVFDAMHDYLVRLLKIRKSAYRQDLPVLLYNLDKLRLVLAGLDRTWVLGVPYNSFQADHRLGPQMGIEYVSLFLGSFPGADAGSICASIGSVCQGIDERLRSLGAVGPSWGAHWDLAANVKRNIEEYLSVL